MRGQQIAFGVEPAQQPHENHASAGGIARHAEGRSDEGFDDFFEGRRMVAGFPLTLVEQGQALLVGRHRPPQDHRFEQRFFGVEMVVDGSQIDFRFRDDAAQGSRRIALLGEQAFRSIEDALLGMIHGRLNQTYDYSACQEVRERGQY